MKITIEFLNCLHIELADGFAWLFIGIMASVELWIAAGVFKLIEFIKNLLLH